MLIIPFDTNHSIPEMKELSSIVPSAHHPALFLIQDGIVKSPTEIKPTIHGCNSQ